MFNRPGGELCMQTSRRRGRRMAGPTSVEEFDLVTGHLVAALL